MYIPTLLIPLLSILTTALPAPIADPGTTLSSPLVSRAAQQCGQYQTQSQGPYSLATNGWGWSTGTGSQCSQINSVSGNTINWQTSWTWSGGPTSVKSYTNVQQNSYARKQLKAYTSMPTTWKWSQTGTNLNSNAAYDTFVGNSASGANTFEVMVWLGLYGTVSPLSANGYPFTPIASTTIAGVVFDLAYGLNGNVKVYSFVARSRAATNFSGDLLDFYKYLAANYASNGFNLNLYLQTLQAGPEVFTGTNAQLTTTAYSISVN